VRADEPCTVGLGLHLPTQTPFVTVNGKRVAVADAAVARLAGLLRAVQQAPEGIAAHFAVGSSALRVVRANFGQMPFLFAIEAFAVDVIKRGRRRAVRRRRRWREAARNARRSRAALVQVVSARASAVGGAKAGERETHAAAAAVGPQQQLQQPHASGWGAPTPASTFSLGGPSDLSFGSFGSSAGFNFGGSGIPASQNELGLVQRQSSCAHQMQGPPPPFGADTAAAAAASTVAPSTVCASCRRLRRSSARWSRPLRRAFARRLGAASGAVASRTCARQARRACSTTASVRLSIGARVLVEHATAARRSKAAKRAVRAGGAEATTMATRRRPKRRQARR
jgi:hypothetical protein